METGDEWLAMDKLQHFLFSFFLTIIFSLLANRTPYSFIRNRSILVGSMVSLAAGAVKEVADEMGYFKSAGASAKDAIFDLLGTLVAALPLYLSRSHSISVARGTNQLDEVKEAEMV
ncbi:hypothetical protein M9H77_29210 [Catharanthus roseus]|uniref:Uncharacterized protein n=1 Tax=Catharanthus roseus TaxID=4058 RepID=A0ACC0AHI2_CATRO|nr:hypothetical protein M9H77_29210 [Catharanthus roseus]